MKLSDANVVRTQTVRKTVDLDVVRWCTVSNLNPSY